MLAVIPLIVLLLAGLALVVLRLARPGSPYAWLVAAFSSLLAWGAVFAWRWGLGTRFDLPGWQLPLLSDSPLFVIDEIAWLFGLSIMALAAAVIWSAPARPMVSSLAWAGTLSIAFMGLLAALAATPLTLALVWMAIDLVELLNTLRSLRRADQAERAVVAFGLRALGTMVAVWTLALAAPLEFGQVSGPTGLLLLLAVGLRLGVLPLHLPYGGREPSLRRGLGSTIRLTAAASGLVLLARIPAPVGDESWQVALVALVSLAALVGGWRWALATDELSGRPFWLIGLASLALAASLGGNARGAAAFGVALVLFGALSFLHSARARWINRLLAGLAVLFVGLPFTLTSTAWLGQLPFSFVFSPALVLAHALLAAGYVRFALRPQQGEFFALPRWAQTAYPLALALPSLTAALTGVWGWAGAAQAGWWPNGVIVLALTGGLAFIFARFPLFNDIPALRTSGPAGWQKAMSSLLWGGYILLARFLAFLNALLEGDGGLLWTLLVLVLLFSLFQGAQ